MGVFPFIACLHELTPSSLFCLGGEAGRRCYFSTQLCRWTLTFPNLYVCCVQETELSLNTRTFEKWRVSKVYLPGKNPKTNQFGRAGEYGWVFLSQAGGSEVPVFQRTYMPFTLVIRHKTFFSLRFIYKCSVCMYACILDEDIRSHFRWLWAIMWL